MTLAEARDLLVSAYPEMGWTLVSEQYGRRRLRLEGRTEHGPIEMIPADLQWRAVLFLPAGAWARTASTPAAAVRRVHNAAGLRISPGPVTRSILVADEVDAGISEALLCAAKGCGAPGHPVATRVFGRLWVCAAHEHVLLHLNRGKPDVP